MKILSLLIKKKLIYEGLFSQKVSTVELTAIFIHYLINTVVNEWMKEVNINTLKGKSAYHQLTKIKWHPQQ